MCPSDSGQVALCDTAEGMVVPGAFVRSRSMPTHVTNAGVDTERSLCCLQFLQDRLIVYG